jgi:hypothetical protein
MQSARRKGENGAINSLHIYIHLTEQRWLGMRSYQEILHPLAWSVDRCERYDAFGCLNSAVRPYIPCKAHSVLFLQLYEVLGSHQTTRSAETKLCTSYQRIWPAK